MAIYEYLCLTCGKIEEEITTWEKRFKPEKVSCICGGKRKFQKSYGASMGDSIRLGLKKVDPGFKEVMAKIRQHHPNQKIQSRAGWDY